MTEKDANKWDARYRENPGGGDASIIVQRHWQRATCGNALDIACGNGRNSLFLARQGFAVDAVDISSVATRRLAGRHPKINVICADLDAWKIPADRYDLIVNIRFLDRNLFSMMDAGLRTGGVLIFESFMGEETDRFCLKPNELLRAFSSFRTVYYEEKKIRYEEKKACSFQRFDQIASLVAMKGH